MRLTDGVATAFSLPASQISPIAPLTRATALPQARRTTTVVCPACPSCLRVTDDRGPTKALTDTSLARRIDIRRPSTCKWPDIPLISAVSFFRVRNVISTPISLFFVPGGLAVRTLNADYYWVRFQQKKRPCPLVTKATKTVRVWVK